MAVNLRAISFGAPLNTRSVGLEATFPYFNSSVYEKIELDGRSEHKKNRLAPGKFGSPETFLPVTRLRSDIKLLLKGAMLDSDVRRTLPL